jgi:hypothetical protein
MDSDVIKIEIDIYRRCNNLSEYSFEFGNTYYFDNECGLAYHSNKGRGEAGYFYFEVIDKHKFFLAKIKYGI